MGIVLREADRLNSLVTDFLQFARPNPPQLDDVDLGEVVASTAALFRNDPARRRVELKIQVGEGLRLEGDAGQLGQVLWNLLANAADAMPEGGELRLEGKARGAELELTISDSGRGIAEEELPHIFEPFYTTKKRGTGLGLMIVQRIVRAHGGRIELESQVGRGTTFRIWLPLHERKPRLLEAPMHD
jgi:two-component system sensor histidine kinase PilS (NtrC family)